MKKLSVIIPAYQAEALIPKCLSSISTNTLDLEVLIVNDGSTDRTEAVCREFAQKDPRICVWTKKNEGPGAAREYAITRAQGEYITFVDADDYIEPGTYDELAQYLDGTLDVVEFGYKTVDTDGNLISRHPMKEERYCGSACSVHYARQKNTTNFLWNKLFKRELFQDLTFPHLFAGEDAALLAQVFVRAKRCQAVSNLYYNYVMTPDSLCRRPFSEKRMDNIRAYQFIDGFYSQHAPALCYYAKQKLCSVVATLYCECVLTTEEQVQIWCDKLISEYKKARAGMSLPTLLRHGSLNRRMLLLLFTLSPKLCAFMYSWKR